MGNHQLNVKVWGGACAYLGGYFRRAVLFVARRAFSLGRGGAGGRWEQRMSVRPPSGSPSKAENQ